MKECNIKYIWVIGIFMIIFLLKIVKDDDDDDFIVF